MSLTCLLCDEEFDMITPSHLKYVHDITLDSYRKMFPGAELVSKETRQQMSESREGHVVTEETRRLISEREMGKVVSERTRQKLTDAGIGNKRALGHRLSAKVKQQISRNETGKIITEEARRQTSKALLGHEVGEVTRQQIAMTLMGHGMSEVTRQKKSESMKERWKDEDFACYMSQAWNRKPNERELQLLSVLDRHFPNEWKYTGDGSLPEYWIEGRNPDFMSVNGKKQVIEVFGYYWHLYQPNRPSEEELIAHYKEYGFDCLVFWEYDVYDEEEVVKRVSEFVAGS